MMIAHADLYDHAQRNLLLPAAVRKLKGSHVQKDVVVNKERLHKDGGKHGRDHATSNRDPHFDLRVTSDPQ